MAKSHTQSRRPDDPELEESLLQSAVDNVMLMGIDQALMQQ